VAERLGDLIKALSGELGIPVVTPEYEIMIALLDEDSMSSDELCQHSSLSRAGFFHAVDRLKHWGFIGCEATEQDRRRKRYWLCPRARDRLIGNLRRYRASRATFPTLALSRTDATQCGTSGGDDDTSWGVAHSGSAVDGSIHGNPRLRHMSCDYQIMLQLFIEPGSTNSAIARATSSSLTKFRANLARLVALGLITRREDDHDRRLKRYFISEAGRAAIARSNVAVIAWLGRHDEHLPPAERTATA